MAKKESLAEDPIEKGAWLVGFGFILVSAVLLWAFHQYGTALVLSQYPGSY